MSERDQDWRTELKELRTAVLEIDWRLKRILHELGSGRRDAAREPFRNTAAEMDELGEY